MTETPQAPTPAPAPADAPPPPPAPGPAQQASAGEPAYTMAEIQAEAQALGIYPWDVAGIFGRHPGVESMTEAEFRAALAEWRSPPAEPAPNPNEGGF